MAITPEDRAKYPYHTDSSILGIKLIKSMHINFLAKALIVGTLEHLQLAERIGPNTNPHWIVAEVAEELYVRGTIDEQELDFIMR
jgi:hypothetical protein